MDENCVVVVAFMRNGLLREVKAFRDPEKARQRYLELFQAENKSAFEDQAPTTCMAVDSQVHMAQVEVE